MSARSLNWLKFGGLVALAFALGLLFAGLLDLPSRSVAQDRAGTGRAIITPVQAPSIPAAKPLQDLSDAFASVADAVRPSVVYIRSARTETTPERRIPPGLEPFFPRSPGGGGKPQYEQGSGSGFIVSADGFILTNNHVVENAENVTVRLLDRREYKAKVVGTDPNTDIAVLKIDAQSLKPVALGNSDEQKIGQWVLAIGNPLGEGLTFTVTSGIISAKGRNLNGLQRSNLSISDFIQTDAAINPGNSGGPLVNVRGEVIGVNSAIASETGFNVGYGFAIPINLARTVMNQLITDGKVHRAALGISIEDADVKDAAYVGLPEIRGVKVADIPNADSPAAKAGIEAGDIIVGIDGKSVERVGQLQQEVGFRKPGETVKVEVARKGGVRKTFNVKLQALEEAQVAQAEESDSDGDVAQPGSSSSAMGRLGVSVQQVTPTMARQFGLPDTVRGLLVTDVVPGGPSQDVLTEPSQNRVDIITEVEGKPVRTEADLRNVLKAEKPGAIVSVEIFSPTGDRGVRRVKRIQLGD
jgi:serine protease Do